MEQELIKTKKQKDEAKKTCEDLASKLSKAYAELEQAKSSVNIPDLASVNRQEEISTLQEKVTSLERERENLEDDLDEREAEIDELKKKIEQLDTNSKEKDKEILNYKTKLDSVNEEIKTLRIEKDKENQSGKLREAEAEFDKRVKDYESMASKLTKEVSSLQGKLSAANQRNKELEGKVKSSMQASHDQILETEIVVRSENQLEYAPVNFGEELEKEQQIGSGEKNGQAGDILLGNESERNLSLKEDFEELKMLSEEIEMKLAKEREKNRAFEDELEEFEIEKRRGLKLYRELEEECNRLREKLNDSESSQNQVDVRLLEKLRTRLKNNEEENEALGKQVDSLRKEVQAIKEARDKGDTLYVNLAEKYKNSVKENKSLEQEKHQREENQDCNSREFEDSLQTQIHELVQMKDEIESMRDNLRALVREKEDGYEGIYITSKRPCQDHK
ncbi:hypothetical protein OS493_039678 [Desmophyllum pertusum]|uniref:Uncharacterized protein n=1 Tax=Desmophyllum pertusum TaxID=174260 RepID=A0A9W9YTV8_9CNID|nr:hypothetical protein OS493_039678 [Desmophyllum pertusum]